MFLFYTHAHTPPIYIIRSNQIMVNVITFVDLTKDLWLIPVKFGLFYGINSGYYYVFKYASYCSESCLVLRR